MLRSLLILLAISALPFQPVKAQAQEAADTVTVLEGVFTAEQAEEGGDVFSTRCSGCHAPSFFQADVFVLTWAGRPVRSLFRRISTTMPEDNPGGLRPEEYAAVVAYLLELNDYPAGEIVLPSDEEALRRILLVQKPNGG